MPKSDVDLPADRPTVREGAGRVLSTAPVEETKAEGGSAPVEVAPVPTIESLAMLHKTPDWVMAALKQRHKWGVGQVITEAKFRQAVAAFLTMPLGKPASAPELEKEGT